MRPVDPLFKADSVTLSVSREAGGKLRLRKHGWEDHRVVEPGACASIAGRTTVLWSRGQNSSSSVGARGLRDASSLETPLFQRPSP
jgi:hypothetical protein